MKIGENRPVALITGASGGIGAALAKEIAQDEYDLVLVSRNQILLEKIGQELHDKYGISWVAIGADLSDPSQVDTLMKNLKGQLIEPELIVNNAGFGLAGPVATNDATIQLDSIQLNILTLSKMTLQFLPRLISQNRGGIINVGSVAGFFPGPNFAVYYASKAYVQSFTIALAHELKATNVNICVICPGTTQTGFHERAGMDRSGVARSGGAMTAEAVAKIGYAGYKKGRRVVVTGTLNRFIVFVTRFIPTSWVVSVVSRFNKT